MNAIHRKTFGFINTLNVHNFLLIIFMKVVKLGRLIIYRKCLLNSDLVEVKLMCFVLIEIIIMNNIIYP